jgi:general secretion pathway protein A
LPLPPTPTEAGIPALRAASQPLPAVMGKLIGLWMPQLQIPRGENVCRFLGSNGLDCYRGSAHWDDLRQMNRPAILTLGHEDGATQYVLLRSLDDTTAVLDTGNGPLRVAIDQLNAIWSGEFLLLWRRPVPDLRIGPQASPEAIAWLRRTLASADGQPLTGTVSTAFSPELRAQLMRFQAARGLDADGVAGARTLIALSNLDRPAGTPTLEAQP